MKAITFSAVPLLFELLLCSSLLLLFCFLRCACLQRSNRLVPARSYMVKARIRQRTGMYCNRTAHTLVVFSPFRRGGRPSSLLSRSLASRLRLLLLAALFPRTLPQCSHLALRPLAPPLIVDDQFVHYYGLPRYLRPRGRWWLRAGQQKKRTTVEPVRW